MLQVIEWPEKGSTKRYPRGGWWVVRDDKGYAPREGPFRTQQEAEDAKARRDVDNQP